MQYHVTLRTLLFVSFALLVFPVFSLASSYVPPRLIRVQFSDKAQVQALSDAGACIASVGEDYVDVIVEAAPFKSGDPVAELIKAMPSIRVLEDNLDRTLDRFRDRPDLGRYHNFEEVVETLKGYVRDYPGLASLHVLGKSREDRPVYALKISDNVSQDEGEPGFLVCGMHHSREWISVEIPLALAEELLTNYDKSSAIKRLVDEREIWVVPVQNPDGFIYSTTEYKMWRKNRRDNGNGTMGVDPNRNYFYEWGGAGASTSTSSDTYRGPSAASEPITQIIQNFAKNHKNLKGSISYHSYGQLVLWPWSYSTDVAPDDPILGKLARKFATFNGYSPKQSADLYPSSGDFDDYMYGVCGLISFTIELGTSFIPAESKVDAICEKNVKALLWFIDTAADPFPVLVQEEPGATTNVDGPYDLHVSFDSAHHGDFGLESIELEWQKAGDDLFQVTTMQAQGDDVFGVALPSAGLGSYRYCFKARGANDALVRLPSEGYYSFDVVERLFLLVDDDNGREYESYYLAAFEELGLPVQVVNRALASPTKAQLQGATAVVWFCGAASSDTLSKSDQALLIDYLGAGGKFLLFGQDIGYNIKSTTFFKKWLKAKYVDDNSKIRKLMGADGTCLADVSFSITGDDGVTQSYPEVIAPLDGAKTLARYVTSKDIGVRGEKIGALAVAADSYRLCYFGFGLEGIDSPQKRVEVFRLALDWVTGSQSLELLSGLALDRMAQQGDEKVQRSLALQGAEATAQTTRRLLALVEASEFEQLRQELTQAVERADFDVELLAPILREVSRALAGDGSEKALELRASIEGFAAKGRRE